MEVIEVHYLESLQVVHHWFPHLHHSSSVHRPVALLDAGKSFVKLVCLLVGNIA